jgi:cardiolipin synthase
VNTEFLLSLLPYLYTVLEFVGIYFALTAIRHSRTSQGAIAWAMSLVFLPFLSLPFYWFFGRSKFIGHINFRKQSFKDIKSSLDSFKTSIHPHEVKKESLKSYERALQELVFLPWLKGHRSKLLINGETTFSTIFQSIDQAKDYILLQFFIVNDDDLGSVLANKLTEARKRGVRVFFIYDAIGSYSVDEDYWNRLKDAGCEVYPFHLVERKSRRLQINFRNHRKITIVDGEIAFFGGHNVGDNYLGKNPKHSPWRDTHVQIEGPGVMALQLIFLEDWYFVNPHCHHSDLPRLNWEISNIEEGGEELLLLPSGPGDTFETCGLMFSTLINNAQERVWIASPYFIPDGKIRSSLTMAALRGVDVRIMLPEKPDHKMVYFARKDFYEDLQNAGVKFYLYKDGFLHQKVILLDEVAGVGTANLDNRSFRLNFELTGLFKGEKFLSSVERMLLDDFEKSSLLTAQKFSSYSFGEQILIKICRLFSPLL